MERSLNGAYTKLVRAAQDISWQSHATNENNFRHLAHETIEIIRGKIGAPKSSYIEIILKLPGLMAEIWLSNVTKEEKI